MSHLTAFGPIVWAKRVPTMRRRDGRPDTNAHHVLLALATYAKRDGSGARPGVDTLAEDTRLSAAYVVAALDRIQADGLISKTGDYNGTAVWTLHLDRVESGPSVHEERLAQKRAADAARAQRYRVRKAARHAVEGRDVTVSDAVTRPVDNPADSVDNSPASRRSERDVTVSHSVTSRPGQRDVTLSHTVTHGLMTVTPAGQTPCIPNELPTELPKHTDAPEGAGEGDAFGRFWAVYPKKTSKAGARRKFETALKTATAEEIIAGAERYAAERAADPRPDADQWTKYPTTWLHNGCWEDEPARPLRAVSGGYQPYRNPIDQSIYDEDLT